MTHPAIKPLFDQLKWLEFEKRIMFQKMCSDVQMLTWNSTIIPRRNILI